MNNARKCYHKNNFVKDWTHNGEKQCKELERINKSKLYKFESI